MKNELLSKRLRDLRKSYDYTQEFVASHLNVSRQAYSHYETGRNTPTMDALYKLAILYSVSMEDLLHLLTPTGTTAFNAHPITATDGAIAEDDPLSHFLDYLNNPANEMRLKSLTRKEKEMLYYFEKLSLKDQDEIIDFIKIKAKKSTYRL